MYMSVLIQICAVATVISYFTRRSLLPHSLIPYALICNIIPFFIAPLSSRSAECRIKKWYLLRCQTDLYDFVIPV